jgi:N-acetylglutamate synthase-like GNAT family acetyltransferase
MTKPSPVRREVCDADSAALIELITTCFAAYPGCVLDVEGEEPWLRAPAAAYARAGGRMWVCALGEFGGAVIACVGLKPASAGLVELKSLYVHPAARRQGLGEELVAVVENEARLRAATAVHLWTDTRFTDAHRLYQRLGYARLGETRALHDRSATVEYHYRKTLVHTAR